MRLGQRVDAFGLDRVLGREHEERARRGLRLSRDRDVAFGHHLEQRRLHLGRRPVDLVGEHHVREHRAPLDVEVLARRPPDPRADDVGGYEIGRELQPGERAADHPGERRNREGLGQTGHTLDQAVTAGEEADHRPLDHAVLADDHPLDLEQGLFEPLGVALVVEGRRIQVGTAHERGSLRAWNDGMTIMMSGIPESDLGARRKVAEDLR